MASMHDPSMHLTERPDFSSPRNWWLTVAECTRRALRDGMHGYYTGKGSRSGRWGGGGGLATKGGGAGGGVVVGGGDAIGGSVATDHDDDDWDADRAGLRRPRRRRVGPDLHRFKAAAVVGMYLVEVTNGMRARQKESLGNLSRETHSFRFEEYFSDNGVEGRTARPSADGSDSSSSDGGGKNG